MKTFLKIFSIKNIIAIILTIIMGILILKNNKINEPVLAIFSASYGSVMTYFFSIKRKDNDNE